jgi:hypothetical protein
MQIRGVVYSNSQFPLMFVACRYGHNTYVYRRVDSCVYLCVCHCFGERDQNKFLFFIFNSINIRHTKRVKVLYSSGSFCITYQFDFCTTKLEEKINEIQRQKFGKQLSY